MFPTVAHWWVFFFPPSSWDKSIPMGSTAGGLMSQRSLFWAQPGDPDGFTPSSTPPNFALHSVYAITPSLSDRPGWQ